MIALSRKRVDAVDVWSCGREDELEQGDIYTWDVKYEQ